MLGQPRIKTLDWLILSKLDRIGSNVGANPTNRVVQLLVQLLSPGQHLLEELDQGVVVRQVTVLVRQVTIYFTLS